MSKRSTRAPARPVPTGPTGVCGMLGPTGCVGSSPPPEYFTGDVKVGGALVVQQRNVLVELDKRAEREAALMARVEQLELTIEGLMRCRAVDAGAVDYASEAIK